MFVQSAIPLCIYVSYI